MWWPTPKISALGRLGQEDCRFEATLVCIVRSFVIKKTKA